MIGVTLFAFAFLLLACCLAWKVGRDLRVGTVRVVGGRVNRTISPGRYYFNIAFQVVAAVLFLSVPLFVLLALNFPNCSSNPFIEMILSCSYAAN